MDHHNTYNRIYYCYPHYISALTAFFLRLTGDPAKAALSATRQLKASRRKSAASACNCRAWDLQPLTLFSPWRTSPGFSKAWCAPFARVSVKTSIPMPASESRACALCFRPHEGPPGIKLLQVPDRVQRMLRKMVRADQRRRRAAALPAVSHGQRGTPLLPAERAGWCFGGREAPSWRNGFCPLI